MNELVVHDSTPIKLAVPPALRPEELVRCGGADVAGMVRTIRELFGTGSTVSSLADAEALLAKCEDVAKLLPRLADDLEQLARPAIGQEIRDGLDLLVESRGSQPAGDRKIYGRMLTEDVAAQQPSIGAFVATTRRVRRTCKYRPEIAEVLEILADEEYRLKFEIDAAREMLPNECARLASAVAAEKNLQNRRRD